MTVTAWPFISFRQMSRLSAAILVALLGLVSVPALADPVRGAGSTFVAPLVERWQQRFRAEQTDGGDQLSVDLGVDYEPVGSLAGVLRATQIGVDFGATDRPLTPEELARLGLAQFPLVIGGIAVVANLPDVAPGALKLSGALVARIYSGEVTRWSDPAIRELNPSLALPDAAIAVIHRSDGSGTTFNLADFLARRSEAWRRDVGVDTVLKWPVGTGAKGNDGIANVVQRTPNAIGYVESGLVARLGLADVQIDNRSGAYVRATAATLSEAALGADWANAREFNLLLNDASGATAYPIVATVFAVVPRQTRTPSRRATVQFFAMALERGGKDAIDLGYVPLPPPLVAQVQQFWRRSLVGFGS